MITIDDRFKEQIKYLLLKGWDTKEIAKFFGVSNLLVSRIKRELCFYKLSSDPLFEQVKLYFGCAKSVLEEYKNIYAKFSTRPKFSRRKQVEDKVLLLSDLHTGMVNKSPVTGKVTYDLNKELCELRQLLRGMIRFYQLERSAYSFETLYIFALGDLISNDRIYEGQLYEVACEVGRQILITLNLLSDFTKELSKYFPKIVWVFEYGNHGRTTSRPNSEPASNNFEYLLAQLMKERFSPNPRVEVVVPEEYYYTLNIRGHKYLLFHGDHIRGTTLNTIENAAKQLVLLAREEPYDVIAIGHFHSCHMFPITPSTSLLVNGCFIEEDNFAYKSLRKFSTVNQFMFNVSKKSALHNLQEINLLWE